MNLNSLHNLLLTLFFGVWLVLPQLTGVILVVLILINLLGLFHKQNSWDSSWVFSPWIGLFCLYFLSTFFTTEPSLGMGEMERKLSLVAFPLLFSFRWKIAFHFKWAWFAHTMACLLLLIIAFYDSVVCQYTLGNSVRCFSTSYFSQVHHPTYFSAFLIFSIIGLLHNYIPWFDKKHPVLRILVILIFSAVHLNLGSLGGILALLLVFGIYFWRLFSRRFGKPKAVMLSVFLLALMFISAYASSEIRADVKNAYSFTKMYFENPEAFVKGRKEPLQGNEVRLILWTASAQLIKEHPLGVGLGQLDQKLYLKLKGWGYPIQASKKFNPHNQYLQIGNEIGILGILIFIALIVLSVRKVSPSLRYIFYLFLLSFLVLCLFESMLQRQSGIVFFLSWMAVFVTQPGLEIESE